jgi:REP element-mobilizing transposase RayT
MPVIAYHCVFSTYGFWLPNDPRGSNSPVVRADNLKKFGPATLVTETRRSVANRPHDRAARLAAKASLVRPEVVFSGSQARSVGIGFGTQVRKSGYRVHACAILPQHVHLVVGRHRYSIEQIVRLMRQAATAQLLADGLHPFERDEQGRLPSVWGQGFRKVYLFTADDVHRAIRYVAENPLRDGKPRQNWSWVVPYTVT